LKVKTLSYHAAGFKSIDYGVALRSGHSRAAKDIGFE